MMIKTLIVDDHEIVRFGIRSLFQTFGELQVEVVGEADNGRTAVEMTQQENPDVVIMDISLPDMNGMEATRQIRKSCPKTKVVILSMHNGRRYVREMVQMGVSGYVLKSSIFDDLQNAMLSAMKNQVYLSPKIAQLITEDYLALLNNPQRDESPLSGKQKEILQLIAEGKSSKEIAAIMQIGVKAVESARHRIMDKLQIDNVADLTKYAIQEGLTSLDF
ncbi:MAG TPA: response regulator transcription factor [Anaerohalosphaeraceae bacterium]|nr:response regulator transcription factor [Anaerohalosphaeraceae bacterium]